MTTIQDEKPSKTEKITITCIDCSKVDNIPTTHVAWYTCSACGSFRGFNVTGVSCTCGCDAFQITNTRLYCPGCGADQTWSA